MRLGEGAQWPGTEAPGVRRDADNRCAAIACADRFARPRMPAPTRSTAPAQDGVAHNDVPVAHDGTVPRARDAVSRATPAHIIECRGSAVAVAETPCQFAAPARRHGPERISTCAIASFRLAHRLRE